ncbi:hypothetical protein RHSIM_Rhsim09G0048900 [Rhododendron simsii]|uniref:Kinetochore protein Nuf2 N-terminal domain-containing protein n=1 Tax=Rhododendron simsii TaxID=118357 RepID=A0A834LFK8_RHOSS|nr:hypothetical protein RHSIM_Rhsim09G0048900 [Rhododendron simsii]
MLKFEYPHLRRAEIIGFLAKSHIEDHIAESDLRNPNPDFILNLYTTILIHLDSLTYLHKTLISEHHTKCSRGIPHHEGHSEVEPAPIYYGQLDFAALEQLENPDLHVDSVQTMHLFRKIKEVLATLDCPKKFNLRNRIKPDADRTELFRSALLNFCIHGFGGCFQVQILQEVILKYFWLVDDSCVFSKKRHQEVSKFLLFLESFIVFSVFRNTKMNLLRPMVEDLTLLDEKRQQLESRISQISRRIQTAQFKLNAEIAEQNELREREMPLVQDVEAKFKELTQIIPSLNNHQMFLKASIKKMKEKAKEMDEKRALEEKKVVRIDANKCRKSSNAVVSGEMCTVDMASKKLSKNLAQMQAIQEQGNSTKSVEKDMKVLKVK